VEAQRESKQKVWHLRNGVVGRPGPGRPPGSRKLKLRPLDPQYFADLKKQQDSGVKINWAQEIARAVLATNPEAIAAAMSKRLVKGNSRVLQTLLSRTR